MLAFFEISPISILKAAFLALSVLITSVSVTEIAKADPITIYTTELDGHHQQDLRGR